MKGQCIDCGQPHGRAAQAKRCLPCRDVHNKAQAKRIGRAWKEKNRDYLNALVRARRAADVPAAKKKERAKYAANAEHYRNKARIWREENPERALEVGRKSRAKNPEKGRAATLRWAKNNPVKAALIASRRRARIRANGHERVTEAQWVQRVQEFEGRCAYCFAQAKLEADHIVPISRGGAHTLSNLVPACRSCNASKHNKLLEEWLAA